LIGGNLFVSIHEQFWSFFNFRQQLFSVFKTINQIFTNKQDTT